jgi:hypothetical protein
VNIDALWEVRQGDDIDIVGGIARRGLDGGGFDETRKAFAITIDSRIDPIADRHRGTCVWIALVDDGDGVDGNG